MVTAYELKSKWKNFEWKFYRAGGKFYACRFYKFVRPSESELSAGISGKATFLILQARDLDELDAVIDEYEDRDKKTWHMIDAEQMFAKYNVRYERL